MRTVATNHRGYATERNISGLRFSGYRVVRSKNLFRGPNYLWFKLTGKINQRWLNLHWDGGRGSYDLLHFFNGLSMGKRPWVTTYETYLPRWGAHGKGGVEKGLRLMAGSHCRKLLALSACARHIQEQYLADFPAFRDAILPKVDVLHPPQALHLQDYAEKPLPQDDLHCVLVGADFFRKGGLETLIVFDRLLQKGHPLQLHIVSSLNIGDYATHATTQDLALARKLIAAHPAHIHYHARMPNTQVMDLFKRAHIGLLPTWADTYGYTVLEAQACGCPVITTDVRALPEINNSDCGWVIPVEKDSWGNARLETEAQRKAFAMHLEARLEALLVDLPHRTDEIAQKGKAALKRVAEAHAPESNVMYLEALYDEILSS